jgi:DNA-binding GntR family transcriptional regulator
MPMPIPIRTPQTAQRSLMWQDAYQVLTEAIVRGDLAPGEQVRDSEIAERLGLSRTPVREAMSRLVDVGLIESKVGAYTRVTSLNRKDAEASLAVLKALDQLAVREGLQRLDAKSRQAMEKANRDFVKAVEQGSAWRALEADDRFHGVLVELADNPLLTRLMTQIHPQIHRILYRKFSTLLGSRETVEHHERLLELCRAGEVETVVRASAEHWEHLGGLIDAFFDGAETG